jgi:subtilase family serine protease
MRTTRIPRWLGASAALAAAAAFAPAALANGARVSVAAANPGWTAKAADLGPAAAITAVNVKVYLTARGGQAALEAGVAAVSTPGSPSYRHFLTPAQYRAQYEPSRAEVRSVAKWLRASGFSTSVERYHRYVAGAGTVAAAEQAFGTTLESYQLNGQVVLAPTSAATVPAAVAGSVLGVVGLDTAPRLMKPAGATPVPPPPGFRNARPCSTTYGQVIAKKQADHVTPLPKFEGQFRNYAVCGYLPWMFRSAYEGDAAATLDGTGVTVAIVDAYAAGTIRQDANTYATRRGDAPFAQGQFKQILPNTYTNLDLCGASGWFGEETLDVEAVHGMAPGANIRYYAGRSCFDNDLTATVAKVIDQDQAQIITNSYGDLGEVFITAGQIQADQQNFLQAAIQGITIMFSSGDSGDEVANLGTPQPDYPASSPYVTAVGGTSTAIDLSGSLVGQTGWGTDKYNLSPDGNSWVPIASNPFLYGAGGGFSTLFNRPAYQNGVVPPGSPAGRAVPDIAMDADPTTGMLVGETQSFPDGTYYDEYRIGGTSLASPLMAGMQALADQAAGSSTGFINPTIYTAAAAGSDAFTDVVPNHMNDGNVRADFRNGVDASAGIGYSLRTFGDDSSLTTATGWDDVTGVGSANSNYPGLFAP